MLLGITPYSKLLSRLYVLYITIVKKTTTMSVSNGTEVNDDITDVSHEDLLQEVLRKHYVDNDLTVKVKNVHDAVPTGNNYLSRLHRVLAEISRGQQVDEKKFIMKMFPKGELIQKFIKEGGIFRNEIKMYTKILPQMNTLSTNILGSSTFSANTFDTGADNIIVLEDLKQEGYRMADRQAGLDIAHCKIAIKTLARFHGISVTMVDADKSLLEMMPGTTFHKDSTEKSDKFVRNQYTELSEVVETWPGFERFGGKLRDVATSAAEKVFQVNDHTNTEMAVLNHGDFWLNNMLFKYSDTGVVDDIKFVDFQMSRFASPAIDLHYFLTTSPCDDVKDGKIDTLLELYHSELCRVLAALESDKVVTLEWLKKELKDKMFYALHSACTVLSLVVAESENVPDFSDMKEDLEPSSGQKSVLNKAYNGAKYRTTLQKLLLMFENTGVL